MSSVSMEAKVGLFVLVGMLLLAYMSFQVGQKGAGLRKGYTVDVLFDNAAGLSKDADVQIAGVEVGRVQEILLHEGKALVRMRIKPGIVLEKDVTAAIKTHGMLGDKYVEITPGTKGSALLKDGEQIAHAVRQPDLDRLINQMGAIADDVKTVTGSLSTVMGGEAGKETIGAILENMRLLTRNINTLVASNESTIRTMLQNTRDLTGNLNRMVVQNDAKVGEVIDNLKSASREMEKTFSSFSEIAEGVRKGEGTDRISKTIASLQEVSDKINQGKGTIGKLINDDETVNNLNESLAGINRYVTKAEQFRTFMEYEGLYLTDSSNFRSTLNVRIQPREDQFYLLGVTSDPRGRRKVTEYTTNGVTTEVEEWDKSGLLFNAQIGKRFRDLVVRGGILQSTGGVGLDYLTLNDRLKLTFEAYDFDRDRRTHLRGGAELQLFKHFYLSGGWDDFISNQGNSSPYVGFSIRFADEDLKYLLTTTPIPK